MNSLGHSGMLGVLIAQGYDVSIDSGCLLRLGSGFVLIDTTRPK